MPNISKESTDFIRTYLPTEFAENIFSANDVNAILDILSDWMTRVGDCWEPNGYDYNDLGRQAQKVYDDIFSQCIVFFNSIILASQLLAEALFLYPKLLGPDIKTTLFTFLFLF